MNDTTELPIVEDEVALLNGWVGLDGQNIIELGCGAAKFSRDLLKRYPGCRVTGLEVDSIQHEKNLQNPQERLTFIAAGAQDIPFPDATFDLAIMLKSLHHVPVELMRPALGEIARVVRPGGLLYVSEPVYAGALNAVISIYNEERVVRIEAQRALDAAIDSKKWSQVDELRFDSTSFYKNFEDFEKKHMHATFREDKITPEIIERVRAAFEPHCRPDGVTFRRPQHARLLRRA